MVEIYAKRIMRGVMTIEEVPALWREKVRVRVEEMSNA